MLICGLRSHTLVPTGAHRRKGGNTNKSEKGSMEGTHPDGTREILMKTWYFIKKTNKPKISNNGHGQIE